MAPIAQAQPFDHAALAERARQVFIIPGYQHLLGRISTLERALAKLCPAPSQPGLEATRAAYRETIAAWARIEVITFGPIAQANRMERIFFWPDRTGIGQRQVRRLLAQRKDDVLSPQKLATKSVAVQGLTALELLLHNAQSDLLATGRPNTYRCRFARSITRNLTRMTQEILASWSNGGAFQKVWAAPGSDNPVYLGASETSLELVKAFELALQNTRDHRIVPAIGLGPKRRKFRPILWRSGLGMVLIHGNIAGAHGLFFKGGLAASYLTAVRQTDATAPDAIESIEAEFDLLLETTADLSAIAKPFKQPATRNRLLGVGFPLKNIRQQAVSRFKRAAGLSIGFNAADGD